MDGNQTPDFAIGAVSTKGEPIASLLRSKPTVYIKPMSKPSANQPNVIDPENLGNFIDLQDLLLLDFTSFLISSLMARFQYFQSSFN